MKKSPRAKSGTWAQDGGIPIISRSWSGNESDSKIFRERAKALADAFKNSDCPRYLVADSKLYSRETIEGPLIEVPFITRVPSTVKQEQVLIKKSLIISQNEWTRLDERNRCYTIDIKHYKQFQRWIVVSSDDMKYRSTKSVMKAAVHEKEKLEKIITKLSKKEFACKADAIASLDHLKKQAKYHQIDTGDICELKKFTSKGRPKKDASHTMVYRTQGVISQNEQAISDRIDQKSCYVIASTVPDSQLSSAEVVAAYKGQNSSVERGFRFLKDPLFFTSSLFVKKTERIMGLLMVMTLALLVYSIAERQLRNYLKSTNSTLPNQIRKEISNPTLRWVFQLLDGIEYVKVEIDGVVNEVVTGLTDLRKKIISCFPGSVQKIYGLAA